MENTAENQKFACEVNQKRREYVKNQCIDAGDLVSDAEAEAPAMSNVHIIKGEVEERPGNAFDRFLGTGIKVSPAELALQVQEKAKQKAYLINKCIGGCKK